MLLSLAQAVDASNLIHTARDIAWIGAMINVLHLLALAVFAGALVILDLRFMGTGLTREPLSEIANQARPWLMMGLLPPEESMMMSDHIMPVVIFTEAT